MDESVDARRFRRLLSGWYREHARRLPWRDVVDPYQTWVSEIMLQQTRVAAVVDHYTRFMARFPTVVALALAAEADVLAAWSGLGYYRRARMLHKAAQFVVQELGGVLPRTAVELRTLPGVGEYTSAAVASIAFGESIAVVDGNVERVILRVMGRAEDASAAGRAFVREVAAELVPARRLQVRAEAGKAHRANAAGDHNQAMMELGAVVCLPRAPLCLQCPVVEMCATKGEHTTVRRGAQQSRPAAFVLALRKDGTATEVWLAKRAAEASLMAGMYELPALPMDAVEDLEPMLRVRHSITTTNYYVEVYPSSARLVGAVVPGEGDLDWVRTSKLGEMPLTGLARKILRRLGVMTVEDLGV
jgi:A/G-specific adenine glycosylase